MKHIFIGGCGRSGTTMLGAMLASQINYIATPESNFKCRLLEERPEVSGQSDSDAIIRFIKNHWRFKIWKLQIPREFVESNRNISFADILDNLVRLYASAHGTESVAAWIDHSPDNISYVRQLIALYPDAKFIHLVRDGRAVAASVLPLDWGPNTVSTAARWWSAWTEKGLQAERQFPLNVLRVKYEDVVLNPESILKRICEFCDLVYSPAMVEGKGFILPDYLTAHGLVGKPPQMDRAMGWKTELSGRQIQLFEDIAGQMLTNLGYERMTSGPLAPPVGKFEALRLSLEEKYWHRLNKMRRQLRKTRIRLGVE